MAKKKRGDAHGGGHGWFVTFADLMGLMMSFFVMLVAFSTMDNNKLKIVAGSMRDAFGMIGTLIGMVQMFANMTDPSKLGPFMATALLATLYGALVANLFCLPIADKLHVKLVDEEVNRTLIIDGILMIRESKSPTLVREMLIAYLPEKHRQEEGEPVPA